MTAEIQNYPSEKNVSKISATNRSYSRPGWLRKQKSHPDYQVRLMEEYSQKPSEKVNTKNKDNKINKNRIHIGTKRANLTYIEDLKEKQEKQKQNEESET